MRTVGVVTTSRADYGVFVPILNLIRDDPDLSLQLIVGGMHLSTEFGSTVRIIEQDGFEIATRVDMLSPSNDPQGIAQSMGQGVIEFSRAYSEHRPDILLVLGDRFEMHSAVVAALPFNLPVAHIAGGESTEGAIDEAIRHSITKMSHLHFVTTETHGERVIQMGEEPWRVVVCGAPGIDNVATFARQNWQDLKTRFSFDLNQPILLVTFHPVTLDYKNTGKYITELLAALDEIDFDVMFTYPNADTHGRVIIEKIEEYISTHPRAEVAINLGTDAYLSMLTHAAAMVGNSSSGIIEAASFKLPVVNIGDRQKGRIKGENVIDVGHGRAEIREGIKQAVSPALRSSIANLTNPYGDGRASDRIVDKLKSVSLNDQLITKHFYVKSETPHGNYV